MEGIRYISVLRCGGHADELAKLLDAADADVLPAAELGRDVRIVLTEGVDGAALRRLLADEANRRLNGQTFARCKAVQVLLLRLRTVTAAAKLADVVMQVARAPAALDVTVVMSRPANDRCGPDEVGQVRADARPELIAGPPERVEEPHLES
jgi:hypothetical protein